MGHARRGLTRRQILQASAGALPLIAVTRSAAAQARSQQLQSQIADSAGQVTELQQEKTVLGQCITSINNFFTVVGENGTSAQQSTAQTTMETDCNAAQKYLN